MATPLYPFLDNNGLLYFWQKIKAKISDSIPKNVSAFNNDAGYKTVDTTYEPATTSSNGLMTSAMVAKLNGIAEQANKTSVDENLSSTSTNPVQNKAVNSALTGKVDKVDGKGLSANDFTNALLNKLNGIAEQANKTVVDTAMSNSSTNPVQNKVVYTALDGKAPKASPAFSGTPTAPTAAAGTNTTQLATTAFVKAAVDNALAGVTGINFEVVTSLPTTGASGTFYLMATGNADDDAYDEYVYLSTGWEKIGSTHVDLSDYVQSADLTPITNGDIDTIVAS